MPTAQDVSFAGLTVVGLDMTIPRGVKPGVARIRLVHNGELDIPGGQQLLINAGQSTFLNGMKPDLSRIVWEHRPNGKREYRFLAYDRRATWPEKLISRNYNERLRDNSIEPSTKKVAKAAIDDVMMEIGEAAGSTAPAAYPPGKWTSEPVSSVLSGLCDILPIHVVRTLPDLFKVEQTGEGDALSSAATQIIPDYLAKIESGPKTIRVVCGPTWFQCGLELEAHGLEADGTYVERDSLSYTPAAGWGSEWPLLFSKLSQFDRGLALRSLYRVYRVKTPQSLPFGISLDDLNNIMLDTHCVVFGRRIQPGAEIFGTYWPYSDHYVNTAGCPLHSAGFHIDTELRAAIFDYPVWSAGSCVDPADLMLFTGFHLRDPDTGDFVRDEFTIDRDEGDGEQVINLPFLWRARSYYANGCGTGAYNDNQTDLEAEAQVYLDAWKDHWDTVRDRRFMPHAGVVPVSLSGNIAEVSYRLGRGLTPKTEISQHYRNSLVRTK